MTSRGDASGAPPTHPHPDSLHDPFATFWMGGFEGADHVTGDGVALDMVVAHGHLAQLEDDHRRAAEKGIGTVRESIGWRLAEPTPGRFDFARAMRIAESARRHGLQVVWTLMHYGLPPDLGLQDDALGERFARFAAAAARAVTQFGDRPPVFNPINEISFLAWAASESNLFGRHAGGEPGAGSSRASGYAIKRRLVQATLLAQDAIRAVAPGARFVQVEPVVHVVAPHDQPELAPVADEVRGYQWQVWDLLAGLIEPELGGHPGALDIVGVNHYHSSQWEVATEARLAWPGDPRRHRLARLLRETHDRYGRPLLVAETSHVGHGRAQWLDDVASEVRLALTAGVPVQGICLYPLVDRPDWNDASHWHHSGLWDVDLGEPAPEAAAPGSPTLRRVLSTPYADALARWQNVLPLSTPQQGKPMSCLIVFSHLRWGFVYQRPQHLMSRLARHGRVVFIEEPVHTDGDAWLECISHGPALDVLVPHTPVPAPGFHDDQLALLEPMIAEFLEARGIVDCVAWLYTPMALPLLASLPTTRAIVYDCMDELAAFRNAPRQLRQRETALLKSADLVLTGGPALYAAKRRLHPNVHCLPSSVDAAHFLPQRLDPGSAPAADALRLQRDIPRPRLGFFGVIDERFDIDMLAAIASARPEWQFVLVGPVVKIDPAHLPRASNIHWLGMQSYDCLPYLMAGWDVCLMPFALNESTRFISPTKTLEYMAGEKPIVSTPVPDVIGLYGDSVRIAATPDAFIAACEEALREEGPMRDRRLEDMRRTVDRSSWDRAAQTVHDLLQAVLERQPAESVVTRAASSVAAVAFEPVPQRGRGMA